MIDRVNNSRYNIVIDIYNRVIDRLIYNRVIDRLIDNRVIDRLIDNRYNIIIDHRDHNQVESRVINRTIDNNR